MGSPRPPDGAAPGCLPDDGNLLDDHPSASVVVFYSLVHVGPAERVLNRVMDGEQPILQNIVCL